MKKSLIVILILISASILLFAEKPVGQEEKLIIPQDYTPDKAWPMIFIYQNQVDDEQFKDKPYFGAFQGGTSRLLLAANKYNFDPFRIYCTGFSRSGHGLLEKAWMYPHIYAAGSPVCEDMRQKEQYGAVQKITQLKYIKEMPILMLHGSNDSFYKTGKKNYEYMKEHGCPVEWGEYKGGHTPTPIYYRDFKRITSFFDKYTLNPYPKDIIHMVWRNGVTRAFWVDAKAASIVRDKERPWFQVSVKENNVIQVDGNDDMKKLDLYLNDKILDMSKDITVMLKDKELYKGKPGPKVTVTLHNGDYYKPKEASRPFWEVLQEFYKTPQVSGSYDWLYMTMNTKFKDLRYDIDVTRRVCLDVGVKYTDSPEKEVIDPKSKKFVKVDVMQAEASLTADTSLLKRKIPVHAKLTSKMFGLQGKCDGGDKPYKMVGAGEAKSGDVIVLKAVFENKSDKEVKLYMELIRSYFMQYVNGVFPKKPDSFHKGIWEISGTRGVQWQFIKHRNEVYQVCAFVMLNPEGKLPDPKELKLTPTGYRKGFVGVTQEVTLKAGAKVEIPMLFVNGHSTEPKAKKPPYPDLAEVIKTIKPQVIETLKEL
jgi:predicted esterase